MFSKILSVSVGPVWNFVKSDNGQKFILTAVVVILIMMKVSSCNALKEADRVNNQNKVALSEAMETIKNKDNTYTYQKALFEGTSKDLKKTNDSLYVALKKEKGNVKIIAIATATTSAPKVTVDNKLIAINDTTKGLKWADSTSNHNVEGISTFHFVQGANNTFKLSAGQTTISKNESHFSLVTGLKEEKGIYKIFITPKDSSVKITDIEGAIIDKATLFGPPVSPLNTPAARKKGGIGIHIGIGMMPLFGTSGIKFGFGPVLSVGYQYHLISF